MPLRKLSRPVQASAKRSTGRVRPMGPIIVAQAAEGVTAPFEDLLKLSSTDQNSKSNQIVDPFSGMYGTDGAIDGVLSIVAPMYPIWQLAKFVPTSNILRQCIESMVVNCESYGHTLEYLGEEGHEKDKDVQEEKKRIEAFLASPSSDNSFRQIREFSRWDQESLGFRTFEIIRNAAQEITGMDHVPAVTMRRTLRDKEPTEVVINVSNPADPKTFIEKTVYRNFCRYVQISVTGQKVYFKEFGDPRIIDPKSGLVSDTLDIEDSATEILYVGCYTPASTYGLPRWIGQIRSIVGSTESEMVNVNFFKQNAIPAMVVLISGGALTADSFDTITQYITSTKGAAAMHRMLVLEASADDTSGSTDHALSAPRIDMKPMISERQQEGLFQEYDDKNQGKVRSSFRLPPIYVGRAEDYTRASAYASMLTAENQVFAPERMAFDDTMNNKVLRTLKPRYWRFKSLGAPITEPDSLSKMLTTFDNSGAITPNVAVKIANKMLDIVIEPILEDWGDAPFPVLLAYIQQGREVTGLNSFLEKLAAPPASPSPPPGNNSAVTKAITDMRVEVRRELTNMADDLRERIAEAGSTVQ